MDHFSLFMNTQNTHDSKGMNNVLSVIVPILYFTKEKEIT